ncbi:MAG: carbohydrate ABC transporter substrate-binding protein, partial [Dorea sp.]|nr:carbohydrate ABC transporter substrate-binding protein [Dorea sp.]
MKRKVIAAFLAATMVLGLAACGSSGGDSKDGGSSGGSSSKSDGKTIRLV